jgi:hypothetical protein
MFRVEVLSFSGTNTERGSRLQDAARQAQTTQTSVPRRLNLPVPVVTSIIETSYQKWYQTQFRFFDIEGALRPGDEFKGAFSRAVH